MSRWCHRSVRRAGVAAVLIASLLATMHGVGLAHGPDPALGTAWPQDTRLAFRWRSGAEPPSAIKTAIRAAADGSNASRASQSAVFAYDSGGSSLIGYGPGATCGVNGIGCFTRTAPDGGFTMWLREHGRVFDWGVLRWCEMYSSPPNGCYQAETIALDEFGHIQGLDHHDNHADDSDYGDAVVQTFSRTRPREGWDMDRYGRCDVARLQLRYDVPGTSAPYSTCLDLATVLSLAASPSSVPYGGTTTLTATLKVTGDTDYGRLQGNPVSRRTVRLQRRPPGGTTWTTVGTMAAGSASGTYVLALKLQARTEFRAVFSTPTSEGLSGDTSSTITVTVGGCSSAPCPLIMPSR